MCNDGQVRLHDGIHVDSWSGVLEVCFNQRWGTVITTANEDNILAGVFCHQLGYLTGKWYTEYAGSQRKHVYL